MSRIATDSPFISSVPFRAKGFDTAAIYCSDGRFAVQVSDFLQNGLGLAGYDRLALAGGPACFAGHFAAYREEEGALSHLRFLAKLHNLSRIILISHQDCGFYRDFLRVREFDLLHRLHEDLFRAARRVREAERKLTVQAYLARLEGAAVWFEPVVK